VFGIFKRHATAQGVGGWGGCTDYEESLHWMLTLGEKSLVALGFSLGHSAS